MQFTMSTVFHQQTDGCGIAHLVVSPLSGTGNTQGDGAPIRS